ncbi:MAG: metallophosphoesterase [Ramlibacter sp.]|nr:metallophosphoesterase [Ramlibacter sp.]
MTRIFALSDIHLDYESNQRWLDGISTHDHQADILLLAGDVSDRRAVLERCFADLTRRFKKVLYVPGNHDLWVRGDSGHDTSFDKFQAIRQVAHDFGVSMTPLHDRAVSIVPLLGWYDYSFGQPSEELLGIWMDYRTCRWPAGADDGAITRYFTNENELARATPGRTVISFSHFLPRIDLMPTYIPLQHRLIYPVLGSSVLEEQIRLLGSKIHVYGHSHVNRHVTMEGVLYVNNALAYPTEARISARALKCIFEY